MTRFASRFIFTAGGLVALSLVSPMAYSGAAFAEDEPTATPPAADGTEKAPEKKKDVKLKAGVLSSMGGGGANSKAVDVASGTSAPGDEVSPVNGSISFIDETTCMAKLFNNSETDAFSVSYQVVGTDADGRAVIKNYYSANLKPKASVSNRVTCRRGLDMQVVLKSGRKSN